MIPTALIELLPLIILVAAAAAVFLYVQSLLNAPDREQFNEEWFRRFEAHQRERYRDRGIHWRLRELSQHFHRDNG